MGNWGFLTNHAHVLVWVTQHPNSTVRQIALAIGLTERATLAILQDLKREGIIIPERLGRRNAYSIDFEALRGYRYWAPSDLPLPESLVQAAVRALVRIARNSAAVDAPARPAEVRP